MRIVVALVLMMLFAGCAQTTEAPDADRTTAPPPLDAPEENGTIEGPPTDISIDYQQCRAGGLVFLVEPENIRRFIPPGYQLEDASELIDMPIESGNAAVMLASMHCEQDEFSIQSLSIYVKERSEFPEEAYRDFYTPMTWMTGPFLNMSRQYGFPINETKVDIQEVVDQRQASQDINGVRHVPNPGPLSMEWTVVEPEELRHTARSAGTTGYTAENKTFRFLHLNENGTLVFDATFSVHGTGGTAQCSISNDSTYEEFLGPTPCNARRVLSVGIPENDVTIRLRWLPF